jgi:hypothetical protein
MLHPIFHLVATQPQLLGQHAQAYGELVGTELSAQANVWSRRALLMALTLCLLGVTAVLAGVATMMWATSVPEPRAAWVLLAVPSVPGVAALACFWLARQRTAADAQAFAELRRQLQADLALLRELGEN